MYLNFLFDNQEAKVYNKFNLSLLNISSFILLKAISINIVKIYIPGKIVILIRYSPFLYFRRISKLNLIVY